MPHEQIGFFAKLIEKELGIVYSEFNYFQLQNRLEEIVRVLSLSSVDELYVRAKSDFSGHLKQLFLDTATNNETSFFRDPKLFNAVKTLVFPRLQDSLRAGRKVRIWSAASSYGQEPYSLAILLRESMQGFPFAGKLEIVATDIASKALERAQSGRYTQFEVQRGLSAALMVKYFRKEADDYWSVVPEIRSMVTFDRQNLLESLESRGKFDLIFCRNVLIYQNVENKKNIIQRLAKQLEPEGYLVMGAGESLIGLSDDFQTVKTDDASFYQLKAKGLKQVA